MATTGDAKRRNCIEHHLENIKRTKTAAPGYEMKRDENFRLTFTHPQTFKSLVEISCNVLKEIEFYIEKSEGFTGVNIETMDTKQVCMVIGRVECDVQIDEQQPLEEKMSFRVKADTLLTCIRALPHNYVLSIFQYSKESDIMIYSSPLECEQDSTCDELIFKMPTLVSGENAPPLSDLAYKYTVNMDLATMRQDVKLCKEINAEDITMEIWHKKDDPHVANENNIPASHFVMKANGKIEYKRSFLSMNTVTNNQVEDNEGNVPVAACEDDEYIISCSEKFSVEYLNLFMKSMDRSTVNLRLSRQKPLLLNYSLDGQKSVVCFVLAPRDDDS